jgi:hypothetical protein
LSPPVPVVFALFAQFFAREPRVHAATRPSLRPHLFSRASGPAKLGRDAPRGCGRMFPGFGANRGFRRCQMRPAGTISDAKPTSKSNCGSGAVVRHQPQVPSSRSSATLLLIFAPCGHCRAARAARGLHLRADRAAGLVGLDQMPMPAKFVMLLGVGKPAHEYQSRQDTSGHDVLHDGSHSSEVSA